MSEQLTNITDKESYPNPMVKIFILGVGILWFDKENDCADFGFVRVPNNSHPLYIDVCEDGRIIHSEELNEDTKIIIRGNSGNQGMGNRFHSSTMPKSDSDFRWIVDLDKVHNQTLKFKTNPDFYARLRIKIKDAIYYTAHKSKSIGTLTNIDNQSQVRLSEQIGQVVGVMTETEGTELLIGSNGNILSPTSKYTIIIRYHCPVKPRSLDSDFEYIYDVLDTNQKFDLEYAEAEPVWITDCEVTRIKEIAENIAKTDLRSINFVNEREKFIADLNYILHKASCEVACQNAAFGEFSRTVPFDN